MRYHRLLYVFFRVGVLGELADRVNFFVQLFLSFLGLGTALAGRVIIFQVSSQKVGETSEVLTQLAPVETSCKDFGSLIPRIEMILFQSMCEAGR